jgi:hypothetical protein
MQMEGFEHFPDWEEIIEYIESSHTGLGLKNMNNQGKVKYEDLLNLETYQLWKLLKKM